MMKNKLIYLMGIMMLLAVTMTGAYNISGAGDYTISSSGLYEVMNDLCENSTINVEVSDVEIINPNGFQICDPVDAVGFTNLTLRGWNSSESVNISGAYAFGNIGAGGSLYIYDAVQVGNILGKGNLIKDAVGVSGGKGGSVYVYNSSVTGSINVNGASAEDNGGKGGNVYVYNSSITGIISAIAGNGMYVGDNGGVIEVDNSTTSDLNATGSSGSISGQGDGLGGVVNVSISTVGNIDVSGTRVGGTINIWTPSTYGTTIVTGGESNGAVNTFEYVPPCSESWVAGWVESVCSSGFRTRVYTDENSCGTISNLPADNGSMVVCFAQSGGGSGGRVKPVVVEPLVVVEEELAEVGTSEGALSGLRDVLSRFWDWLTFWN